LTEKTQDDLCMVVAY